MQERVEALEELARAGALEDRADPQGPSPELDPRGTELSDGVEPPQYE